MKKKKMGKITFQSYNIALLLLPTFIIFFSLIILVCGKLLLQQLCLPALSKHEMFIPFMFYRYMNLNCTKALRKMKRHFILCVFFPHLFMFVFLKINSHIHKHTLTFHDTSSSSISLFIPSSFSFRYYMLNRCICKCNRIFPYVLYALLQNVYTTYSCMNMPFLFILVLFDTFHLLFIEKMRTKKNLILLLIK